MLIAAVFLAFTPIFPGQWTLKSGSKASIVFVLPSEKKAWRPDGKEVKLTSIPKPSEPVWTAKTAYPYLLVCMNPAHGMGVFPNIRFKLPSIPITDAAFTMQSVSGKLWVSGYCAVGQPIQQDIAIGISDGAWETVGWTEFKKSGDEVKPTKHEGIPFGPQVSRSQRIAGTVVTPVDQTTVKISTPSSLNMMDVRVIALDQKGNPMQSYGWVNKPAPERPDTYSFKGDFQAVGRIEIQARPFEWHTIPAAHFRPN